MTLLELLSATTETRLISARVLTPLRFQFLQLHDVLCQPALLEQCRHDMHGFICMLEESLVPLAEVIQSCLPIGRLDEAILGALPIANMYEFTIAAVLRQAVPLILTELSLFFRGYELDHRCLQYVSQIVIRLDEVVAGIKIAVMFQSHALTARRPEDADGPGHI